MDEWLKGYGTYNNIEIMHERLAFPVLKNNNFLMVLFKKIVIQFVNPEF